MATAFSVSIRAHADRPKRHVRTGGIFVSSAGCEPLEARRLFSVGATVPYVTYEAENSAYTGTLLGPSYAANTVQAESSGRKTVRLNSTGQYVQAAATATANSLVVRYSIPDTADGVGQDATISLYVNGVFKQKLNLTSKLSWQYGDPAASTSNTPSIGTPRNFYDEVRVKGLTINAGDTVRVQRDVTDTAATYDIDLMDMENVAGPLAQPANSLNVKSAPYNAVGDGTADDTIAIRTAINDAIAQGKTVWIPAGSYKLTSFIYSIHDVTIQGAGMWHTTFVGNAATYNGTAATSRIGLMAGGSNVHLNDFAITGALNHRTDTDDNDGIGGFFGTGSSIDHVWIEHTKVGMWIKDTSGMTISNARVRDTLADGINLYRGVRSSTVSNSAMRGTGDDAFAIFPAYTATQAYAPGLNVITHVTAVAPYRANGVGIYGGDSNSVDNSLFQDIPYGSGVLISSTFFQTGGVTTQATFSGTTVVRDSDLIRAGGTETLAAVQFGLTKAPIAGVSLSNLQMIDNPYAGIRVHGTKALTNATATGLTVTNFGLAGAANTYGLFVESTVINGGLTISNSTLGDYGNQSPTFKLVVTSVTGVLPTPWLGGDVNTGSVKGTTSITGSTFTIAGTGGGIKSTTDGFRFVSQSVSGDRTLIARVDSLQSGTPSQAGLMIRNDASAGSAYVGVLVTPTGGISFLRRATAGGSTTTTTVTGIAAPVTLKLARVGNAFSAFYSTNGGGTWIQIGVTATVALNTAAAAGMAVSSGNKSILATAVFSNVSVI